jgi:hypothetical protein
MMKRKAREKMIDKAIVKHSKWKKRLRNGIKHGYLGVPVVVIRNPAECEFGRFLRETEPSVRPSNYDEIIELHREFHEKAAEVAELAMDGRKDEAMRAMESGSEYGILSAHLISALTQWKYGL